MLTAGLRRVYPAVEICSKKPGQAVLSVMTIGGGARVLGDTSSESESDSEAEDWEGEGEKSLRFLFFLDSTRVKPSESTSMSIREGA